MTTPESRESMRAVAQSPVAFAGYLADIQSTLLSLSSTLEMLAQETRVELRSTHVEGDRRYHAPLRAMPVERQLRGVIKSLEAAADAAERTVFRRRTHDSKVAALPGERAAKALAKANKNGPKSLPVNQNTQSVPMPEKSRYDEPKTIRDLRDLRSAG